jgi:hypothetical protein
MTFLSTLADFSREIDRSTRMHSERAALAARCAQSNCEDGEFGARSTVIDQDHRVDCSSCYK